VRIKTTGGAKLNFPISLEDCPLATNRLEVSFRWPRQELPNDAPMEAGFVSFPVKTLPTTLVVPEGVTTAGDFTDYFPRRDGPPLEPPYVDYGGLSATFSLILVTPRGTPSAEWATSEARHSSCRQRGQLATMTASTEFTFRQLPDTSRTESYSAIVRDKGQDSLVVGLPVAQKLRAPKRPAHLVLSFTSMRVRNRSRRPRGRRPWNATRIASSRLTGRPWVLAPPPVPTLPTTPKRCATFGTPALTPCSCLHGPIVNQSLVFPARPDVRTGAACSGWSRRRF